MYPNNRRLAVIAILAAIISLAGCYRLRPSNGGGQTDFAGPRPVNAADVAVPAGYRVIPVARGLTFPTGIAFDTAGTPYVVESGYPYGEVWTVPRLLRVNADGSTSEVARGARNGPWTGVSYANGAFYAAEGGELEGGRILRIGSDGGAPELVAWGLRNPFGLAFAPDGRLYATENGYDDRGSRPLWGTPDVLWRIDPGTWYGWPDYSEGQPVNQELYKVPGKGVADLLLAQPPGKPPRPAAVLGVHASSNGFDFSRSAAFGHVGEAFIAEFGDQAPATGKSLHPVGFRVIRVDPGSGRIEDFAVNRSDQHGPASKIGGGGLERPIAARFDPAGTALYVVDFGVLLQAKKGSMPQQGTGVLWKITREGP